MKSSAKKLWIGIAIVVGAVGAGYYYNQRNFGKFTKLQLLENKVGYKFDENGVLRNIQTGGKFEWKGQENYDKVGNYVTEYIQEKMRKEYNMKEVFIPSEDSKAKNNIFMTEEKNDKLLVLIQGSGAVR